MISLGHRRELSLRRNRSKRIRLLNVSLSSCLIVCKHDTHKKNPNPSLTVIVIGYNPTCSLHDLTAERRRSLMQRLGAGGAHIWSTT